MSSVRADARRYLAQQGELYGPELYLGVDSKILRDLGYASLDAMEEAICTCTKCPLGYSRNQFVFGVGNPSARLVLVGEAPGREEDMRGEPFVGPAGRLLDKILAAVDMSREEVYIANVVKCRPPENRAPRTEEVETCLPYLETQIGLIRPKLIVALGGVAAQTLLSSKESVASLRNRIHDYMGIDLMVTYHPAGLLRNPQLKRPCWEDMKRVRDYLSG